MSNVDIDLGVRAQKIFIGDLPPLPDPLAALVQKRALGEISQSDFEATKTSLTDPEH